MRRRGPPTPLAGEDDVRDIDWNVTARLQTPYVRVYNEDREVTAWFLLDLEAAMNGDPAARSFAEIIFSYPGFQSYWCAQHLLRNTRDFTGRLDDITATLGRRSRVRLWEDTLVLLAGMMDSADPLIRRIIAGSSMGYGEHAFLAARCIHEAALA